MGENHEKKVREILIKELKEAKKSIRIVSAYFLDMEIIGMIKEKAKDGVKAEIIMYDDFINSPVVSELNVNNIKLLFYGFKNYNPIIYQKYCIIDGELLVSGYNSWSYAACEREHDEFLVTNNEKGLVSGYLKKFDSLAKHCGFSRLVHVKDIFSILKYF